MPPCVAPLECGIRWGGTDCRSDDVRNQAADDLRAQVTSYTQEFPGHDNAKEIWGEIFHRTFDLTRSNTLYERLGATKAIGTLFPARI